MAVIDASVVALWLLREPGYEAAEQFALTEPVLTAPDLIVAEVGSVMLKHAKIGTVTMTDADLALNLFIAAPIEIIPSSLLISDALAIASTFGRSIYDSLYLALAQRTNIEFATGDERLVNAMRQQGWSGQIRLFKQS